MKKILCFSGSTRKDSLNKKLIQQAVSYIEEAQHTLIDLRDYPLPLYDGDLESTEGLPEKALELKKLFLEHQGLLLACPEYNSSMSAVFKNTIDWVSRPLPEENERLICFKDKTASLMSASPGALGGMRGLVPVRLLLSSIRVTVLPDQFCLSEADNAFDENHQLIDQQKTAQLKAQVLTLTQRLL